MRGLGAFWIMMGLGVVVACGDDNPGSGPDASQGGVACADGIDNDGDGTTDFPDDLGCENSADTTEEGVALPQCSDGRDNDGDGKTDFPDDPGCPVAQADSETDDCPDGATCPQCANGVDDDGNGMTDFPNDPGCDSAADAIEFTSNPNACGTGLVIEMLPASGMVTGMLDASSTSGIMPSCGGFMGSPGRAYVFTVASPKIFTATTDLPGTAADTVLVLRGANCTAAASELACNDDASTEVSGSTITASLTVGTYYLIVQGQNMTATGAFALDVRLQAGEGSPCTMTSECGDGLVCRTPLGGSEMICTAPVCADGVDDDGDGKIDFPLDPGCASPADDSETDTCPGAGCPQCADGLDNDGDTLVDYPLDTGCKSAGGPVETCDSESDPIETIAMPAYTGTFMGATDDVDSGCGLSGGRDRLYLLDIPALATLTIDTENSTSDTVLALLPATCSVPELACNDDGGVSDGSSLITRTNVAAGTYVIAVDGYDDEATAAYNLNVRGTIATGGSCESPLFTAGVLACAAGVTCEGPAGARTCRTQCSDGVDNNMDGDIDYPADPGCETAEDNTETTVCPGAGCPQCSDGVDNNMDGATDYPADLTCAAAGDPREGCSSTEPVVAVTAAVTSGTTVGQTNDVAATCGGSTSAAPDLVYQLDVPALDKLDITFTGLSTGYDMVHSILGASCGGTALSCRDPNTTALTNVAAGRYFVAVDGYASDDAGAFTMTVAGTIGRGGSCEHPLFTAGALTCAAGYTCDGAPGARTCTSQCSDGVDNNNDGATDYPADPGCSALTDNTETTVCPGASCPQCSDGVDNNSDGAMDYPADPTCTAAGDGSEGCAQTEPVTALTVPTTTSTTAGRTNDVVASCGSSSSTAADLVYQLDVPALVELEIRFTDLASGFDMAHSVLDSTCGGTALSCRDPNDTTLTNLAAGRYHIVVDGYAAGDEGSFTMSVQGTVAPGGSCESGLFATGVLSCTQGHACSGMMGARTCSVAQCSDGVDNNNDGRIDYPYDAGCASPNGDTEGATCPGAACPVCADSTDNDGDSTTDFPSDVGCSSAGSTSEAFCPADVDFGGIVTMPATTGTLAAPTVDNFDQSCQSSTGPETTFALSLPVPLQSLVLDTDGSTATDTVLSLRDASCTRELACDDDSSPSGLRSRIELGPVSAGNYAVIVDGYGSTNDDPITLNVRGVAAAGTACSSPLFTSGVLVCATGTTCTANVCQ